MKSIRFPSLPARISGLERIACNLNWSWNHRAIEMFRLLDPELWMATEENPVRMLSQIDPAVLAGASNDPEFIRQFKLATKLLFGNGRRIRPWFEREYPQWSDRKIAYFSAEFGIHSSLPIYSGGLGILAGDHCKQASDLGVPIIGVGFVYPQGYFHQRINEHGWQEDIYEMLDRRMAPIEPASTASTKSNEGNPRFLVELSVGASKLFVEVWQVRVGSVCMYLMDTDVQENNPVDRELTARLYGGDKDHRVRQEIVLGIGGVRVLRALGIQPDIFHGNEGHTSFMLLERVRELVKSGLKFDDAVGLVRAASIFTTHTPVPAGHDAFPFSMIETHFAGFWDEMGIPKQQFLDLGSYNGEFNMTVLSMSLAGRRNAVSKLHGRVTRRMWSSLWPTIPEDEIPVASITNGVHAPTWIAPELARLFDRHFGAEWLEKYDDVSFWNRVTEIPDEDFWHVHQILKKNLLSFAREQTRMRWANGAIVSGQAIALGTLLDPDTLTIGFARRFTAYKRPSLLFQDLDRIKKILLNKTRPVQIVFAGKAHPADEKGKELIHQIFSLAADHSTAGRVAFIENYDLRSAHFLIQGVDVWLNNPRAPLEACGTSGQKAGMNGAINLSILDGWWYEGFNDDNGWAIGDPPEDLEVHDNDVADAAALYELLEQEVVPLYYDRDQNGLSHGWIQMAKESIRSIVPQYSASRMLKEYAEKLYVPALSDSVKAEEKI